jgi:hypothetical protein
MVWLRWEQAKAPCHAFRERCVGGGGELPSQLHAVRNSSVESSIMAHHGVDVLLHVEPMKVAPASPLLGERLRPPK